MEFACASGCSSRITSLGGCGPGACYAATMVPFDGDLAFLVISFECGSRMPRGATRGTISK
jgi:hypothetical protein